MKWLKLVATGCPGLLVNVVVPVHRLLWSTELQADGVSIHQLAHRSFQEGGVARHGFRNHVHNCRIFIQLNVPFPPLIPKRYYLKRNIRCFATKQQQLVWDQDGIPLAEYPTLALLLNLALNQDRSLQRQLLAWALSYGVVQQ